MALRSLEWGHPEDIIDHWERLAEPAGTVSPGQSLIGQIGARDAPCLKHLQESTDGRQTDDNVRASRPCVGHSNRGPREGEEFLKGFEEYTPRPVVPARTRIQTKV